MIEALHHPLVPEFICEFHSSVADVERNLYQARIYALSQGKGIWTAVIVFFPEGEGPIRRTHPEAEFNSRTHVAEWAATITPPFLEAALERSHPFTEAGAHGPEHVEAAHGMSVHAPH